MLIAAFLAAGESAASSSTCVQSECQVTGYGATQRSLWVPGLPQGIDENFAFDANGGVFEVFADGTARISGTCINMGDPCFGFLMEFHFTQRHDWNQWSGLGRSWKGNSTIVGSHYLDWDYYILDDSKVNTLTGLGLLEGSLLTITHMPADYNYGLQVGLAANDKNGEQGMSFWFNYSGEVLGQAVSDYGDINLEGGCEESAVLDCPVDITVACIDGAYLPELTGQAVVNCQESYALSYSDEIIGEGCSFTILRQWVATNMLGETLECTQTISVLDNEPPVILGLPLVLDGCDLDVIINASASDNCDPSPQVTVEVIELTFTDGELCEPGQLRTQTIGGWGAPASGNNPGVYRDANFASAFPNGLTIGCANTLTLNSAQSVQAFLPSGGSPSALPAGAMVDPGLGYNNVFASQLVGITLSLGFDAYDPNFGASEFALANVVYAGGPFAGMTLSQVVAIANQAIGGCPTPYTIAQLNTALTAANENYVDGTQDNGAFTCASYIECGAAVTLVITATDACGNSSVTQQTIFVDDYQAPSFIDPPGNITVECGDIPEPEIAIDSPCSSYLYDIEVSELYFSGACQPTIQRTYTVTGACGTVITHTHFITVVDHTSPVFMNAPDDLFLNCGDDIPDFTPDVIDNCGVSGVVMTEYSEVIGCAEVIIRAWTANDFCGNSATLSQTIHIASNEGPVLLYAPVNTTVSCGELAPLDAPEFASACGGEPLVVFNESQSGAGCEQTITRTWVATDACDNQTIVQQQVAVIDDVPPVFTYVPSDITLTCGASLPDGQAYAIDQCSAVSVTMQDFWSDGSAGCATVTRVFTATDACGNSSIAQQVIQFNDHQPPVFIGLPAAEGEGCDLLQTAPEVTAYDSCNGFVPVSYSETTSTDNCVITVVRTWVAIDQCGNEALAQQVVTHEISSAPVVLGLPEVTVECAELTDFGLIQVDSECVYGLTLSFVDVLLVTDSPCEYTLSRQYTISDACGNEVVFDQMIHVEDNTPPVFTSALSNVVLGCGDDLPPAVAEASDNCSDVTIGVNDLVIANACGELIQRTFTASDACGNVATHVQIIERIDQNAPMFIFAPADMTIDCSAPVPPVVHAEAVDGCSAVSIQFNELVEQSACGGESLLRIWTATDACGNEAVATQLISRIDSQPPVFGDLPSDIEAECGALPPPANVTAFDACSEVIIAFSEVADSGGCPNIYRIWTATDACGNSVSHTQTIMIDDNEPPVLTGIPPSTTASCNALPPLPEPQVTDNCDDNVSVAFIETVVGSGCSFTIIRTWIASDNCGNTAIVSQSIVVEDTEDPVFVEVPAVQTVECGALEGIPLPTVTDDCGNTVTITFDDEVVGSGCNQTIYRTYTATDLCGNSSTASTVIEVIDGAPPVIFGVGPNTMVACDNIPLPNAAFAIDACAGQVELTVEDTVMGEGCEYIISRTYSAADACGNAVQLTQLIYVTDTSGPVFSGVPASVVIDCNDLVPNADEVNAFDTCSGVVPVHFTQFAETGECFEVITRIWSATDACGNTSTAVQTITITDQTPPVFVNLPLDRTVTCDAIPDSEVVVATDLCSEAVVTMTEEVVLGSCPYEIRRTFMATDACGNTAVHVQKIFVIDNEPPVLEGEFGSLTVACGDVPEAGSVLAYDNCSGVELFYTEEIGAPGCLQMITRTWTAIDLCGNTSVAVQQLFIIDDEAPVFVSEPHDIITNCLMIPAMEQLDAWDACSDVTMMTDEVVFPGECSSEFTLIRVWIASDACGNEAVAVQEVRVIDDVAPILTNTEDDMVVGCGEVPEPAEVSAFGACDDDIVITYSEQIIELGSALDECTVGNAIGFSGDLALWLPGIDGIGENYVYGPNGGTFNVNTETGQAMLTGVVFNTQNANLSWYIELALHEQRDWNQWSALGRDYKDDLGIAAEFHQEWTYYVLDAANTRLIGLNALEGSELTLSHAPADTTFGFQLGMNANNHSVGFGLGGWFFYSGHVIGTSVNGHGDFFTIQNCCPEQHIIRTWTAVDCAGNTSVHVQNIYVVPGHGIAPYELLVGQEGRSVEFDVRGTFAEEFIIEVATDFSGRARVELFDLHGRRIALVREWDAIEGAVYTFRYPKAALVPGMYLFMMSGNQRIATDTEMVIR